MLATPPTPAALYTLNVLNQRRDIDVRLFVREFICGTSFVIHWYGWAVNHLGPLVREIPIELLGPADVFADSLMISSVMIDDTGLHKFILFDTVYNTYLDAAYRLSRWLRNPDEISRFLLLARDESILSWRLP
ncbi:hypothetical protein FOZ60_015584 [Perkinsus olseni]|uniref:Uncharacterized protein n=1 Tax=Perkinsus olseni TaxID=32597 RepID=A0A7J6N835_PEROL|nr:hypothetical protein FOZ60_015584 [Perkinsus olseni]